MQALKLVPTIHYFDTFKDFNDEFKLGKGDILVTNEWMYKPYVEGLGIDMPVIFQEKYGMGEPTDEMMDAMKAEMDQLSRIRSHIRKVMPDVLEARDTEGRRTFADYTEQQANQQELDRLLQQTADQVSAHGSTDDIPDRQPEVIRQPTKDKGSQTHDETR